VLDQHPDLSKSLNVFVSDGNNGSKDVKQMKEKGVAVHLRRVETNDMKLGGSSNKYYLCTPVPMRKELMNWLPGKELIFEDFNF
jgi:hypothetical protein